MLCLAFDPVHVSVHGVFSGMTSLSRDHPAFHLGSDVLAVTTVYFII
jgi:hypothetical protein